MLSKSFGSRDSVAVTIGSAIVKTLVTEGEK
jgi:hypothetical protein